MNYVVVCPDKYCRGVSILSKKLKTPSCRKCNKSFKWEKFKIAFETEDHQLAINARTELLTKQSSDGPDFEEIEKSGGLTEQERAYSNKDYKHNDNKSDKDIILDMIENLENPTRENVINKSINTQGLSEKNASKMIDRLLLEGFIIKDKNKLILI